jgi:hypothetical protein
MNSDVTKRKLIELHELGIRYARFFDQFRDTALEVKGDRVILKLSPKTDARGVNRLYPVFPPGYDNEVIA